MSRQRFITLLVAALIAISGALYLSTQRNLPRDPHGTALLPSLAAQLNTVTALSVRRAGAAATVHERDGRWTVAERGDYPADVSKVRKLLLALSDAKIMEEKTSNPANFSIIGVDDPSLPGASGAEVSFTAHDGKHSVIVGKPTGEGNFARRGGENTSYSVEPGITFETEPRFWIDSRLLDIPAADIQSILVKPATGTAYTVRRDGTGANYTLDGIPPGRKALDSASLAPSPTLLTGLTADDATPVDGIDFSKPTAATVTTSDGDVITITGTSSGDKHWIRLQASKDAALNAKAAGRAFEIASYRFDAIFRPVEQLLVPKAAPDAAKPSPRNASKAAPPTKKPGPATQP
ncbi:MAG TPA: DUF4340 domain-containing protein [Steroidobacteraceae bacterium]|jgi:hypothetical protein|nr:DUF4340 domain-containing protein [Steroidobacteraceae bacterium]